MFARAILAVMIGAICVARVASAEPAPLTSDDYVGRWVSKNKALTLDVTRCDKGLCGVVVAEGACGYTALRASEAADDAASPSARNRMMSGRLQLAANTQSYGVKAVIMRDDGGTLALQIVGHTGGAFAPMRRTFDYNAMFVRVGDPTCTPTPKVS